MAQIRVRLKTARVRLEFDGEEALFERQIERFVLGIAGAGTRARARSPAGRGRPAAGPDGDGHPGAEPVYRPPADRFGTFQRQLDPRENGAANRIAAFAFFLWNYERKEIFQEAEIAGCFEAAEDSPPENAEALYADLKARRMLRPAGEAGSWRLTDKGRSHVRHHLLSA